VADHVLGREAHHHLDEGDQGLHGIVELRQRVGGGEEPRLILRSSTNFLTSSPHRVTVLIIRSGGKVLI